MKGFNFQQIADTITQYVDTDYIDIKRNIDGVLTEVYSNVLCHIAYKQIDNPNPETVDINPIIQTLTIHCMNYVDIRNEDFIIAKKTDIDGNIIAVYKGRCGNPSVSQGRKKVVVTNIGTDVGLDEVTPNPPTDPVSLTVSFVTEDGTVLNTYTKNIQVGSSLIINPSEFEGYAVSECYINDELNDGTSVNISSIEHKNYTVKFVYVSNTSISYIKYLLEGLYTKDDGSYDYGKYLYKKIDIDEYSLEDDEYIIKCTDHTMIHEDTGSVINWKVGMKIKVYTEGLWLEITEVNDDEIHAVPADEEEAYETRWYD